MTETAETETAEAEKRNRKRERERLHNVQRPTLNVERSRFEPRDREFAFSR
jgi:hypothetical protein